MWKATLSARVTLGRPLELSLQSMKSTLASPELTANELNSNLKEMELQSTQMDGKLNIPFARAKIGPFFQAMPELGNQFLEDVTMRNYLKRHMPDKVFQAVSPDLENFGHRVANDILDLHNEINKNPPYLEQYNAWGKRVDDIVTCRAWKQMKTVAAEEGLISIAYKRDYQQWSRMYQMAKLYLFAPSAGLYSCPLAMTDGAAKSLEVLNDPVLMEHAFPHLTSRDPAQFWTSGQWMTERKGGSDVANGTQTLAVPQEDGTYKLYGYKWFTSATDSDMTLTLARTVGQDGKYIDGTKGLSMFYLEVRDQDGALNNIEVQRLKDKLGTRQVPTAELLLDGARAVRITEEGRGVPGIANMLTLTRVHNAITAASGARRIVNLARDYTTKRECFGKVIKDHVLHIKNLANMEVETRAATLLTLEMTRLLGLDDCGMMTDVERDVFRLMTPVMKLYTAKQAVAVASEGLECFGGAGYLEDTGLPLMLRDAQVLPIWEGTTNILSLDVLRALAKTKGGALKCFHQDVSQRLTPCIANAALQGAAKRVKQATEDIVAFASQHPDKLELAGREFAYSLARTYMGMLLLEHAAWDGATEQDVLTANRWCQQDLTPVVTHLSSGNYNDSVNGAEFKLVFDGYVPTGGSSKL